MGTRERLRRERILQGLEMPYKNKIITTNFLHYFREQRNLIGDTQMLEMLNTMAPTLYRPSRDGC